MGKAINGKFENMDQARNTRDDLIGSEIPQDRIFIDEDEQTIRVMLPSEEAREVYEIFDRHGVTYKWRLAKTATCARKFRCTLPPVSVIPADRHSPAVFQRNGIKLFGQDWCSNTLVELLGVGFGCSLVSLGYVLHWSPIVMVNRWALILFKQMQVLQLFSGLFQLGVMSCLIMTLPEFSRKWTAHGSTP
jgi:hypothetical protein